MNRTHAINDIIKARNYQTYLEIGWGVGSNYEQIFVPHKVCVDLHVKHPNVIQADSLDFLHACILAEQKFDCIFIDGYHQASHVLQEYALALQCLNEYGTIIFHDVSPTHQWHTRPVEMFREGEAWCGDVYKAWIEIRESTPFFTYTIDTDWGIGVLDTTREKDYAYELGIYPMDKTKAISTYFQDRLNAIGCITPNIFKSIV